MVEINTLKIDPEYKALIPPLSSEELALLEENVVRDGVRDSLVVWEGRDILLDGHHRYDLARKHSLVVRFKALKFESRDDAKRWVIENQCGRRNLSESQRAMCAARLASLTHGGDRSSGQLAGCSQEAAANAFSVSERSLRRAKAVLDHGDPEIIEAVVNDEMAVSAAEKKIRANRVVFNSGESEWYTPEEYVEAARKVMGSIDLDPASCEAANATVKATEFFTKADDGLAAKWHGNVWLNPPYAMDLITKFITAVVEKYEAAEIEQAIVLTNNATETRWFQALLGASAAVCFPSSRIRFIDKGGNPSSSPLQGQAIFCLGYLGGQVDRFRAIFSAFGQTSVWGDEAAKAEGVRNEL